MTIIKSKNLINENNLKELINIINHDYICGVDEVGRGPLAGPVVAAAVIMPRDVFIDELNDSKKMSKAQRERVFNKINELSLIFAVGIIDNDKIDSINILRASLLAMKTAVDCLKKKPNVIFVDGIYEIPNLPCNQHTIVGGDSICSAISAASVIAKVTRDRIMENYQNQFTSFTFSKHKGYPTANHLKELKKFGPTEIHRKTYKPVAELINQYAIFE
jgi:ribonuclease HII